MCVFGARAQWSSCWFGCAHTHIHIEATRACATCSVRTDAVWWCTPLVHGPGASSRRERRNHCAKPGASKQVCVCVCAFVRERSCWRRGGRQHVCRVRTTLNNVRLCARSPDGSKCKQSINIYMLDVCAGFKLGRWNGDMDNLRHVSTVGYTHIHTLTLLTHWPGFQWNHCDKIGFIPIRRLTIVETLTFLDPLCILQHPCIYIHMRCNWTISVDELGRGKGVVLSVYTKIIHEFPG